MSLSVFKFYRDRVFQANNQQLGWDAEEIKLRFWISKQNLGKSLSFALAS